jgi:hypothetical protein
MPSWSNPPEQQDPNHQLYPAVSAFVQLLTTILVHAVQSGNQMVELEEPQVTALTPYSTVQLVSEWVTGGGSSGCLGVGSWGAGGGLHLSGIQHNESSQQHSEYSANAVGDSGWGPSLMQILGHGTGHPNPQLSYAACQAVMSTLLALRAQAREVPATHSDKHNREVSASVTFDVDNRSSADVDNKVDGDDVHSTSDSMAGVTLIPNLDRTLESWAAVVLAVLLKLLRRISSSDSSYSDSSIHHAAPYLTPSPALAACAVPLLVTCVELVSPSAFLAGLPQVVMAVSMGSGGGTSGSSQENGTGEGHVHKRVQALCKSTLNHAIVWPVVLTGSYTQVV